MNGSRSTRPGAILAGVLVAALALLAAELGKSAADGGVTVANPCKPRAPFAGHGVDATIQGIVLDGLDGAACRLHTSREELVLTLRSGSGTRRWDQHTIEAALRAGMLRAVDGAQRRGDIPGFLAPLLRRIVETAPLEKLIEGGIGLHDLFG
jgi:hypothetical protein